MRTGVFGTGDANVGCERGLQMLTEYVGQGMEMLWTAEPEEVSAPPTPAPNQIRYGPSSRGGNVPGVDHSVHNRCALLFSPYPLWTIQSITDVHHSIHNRCAPFSPYPM